MRKNIVEKKGKKDTKLGHQRKLKTTYKWMNFRLKNDHHRHHEWEDMNNKMKMFEEKMLNYIVISINSLWLGAEATI